MPHVKMIFWRAITAADFFNIERNSANAPHGGGGQSYISISFRGLTHKDFEDFLRVGKDQIAKMRPKVTLDVSVVTDLSDKAQIEFAPRYVLPHPDDRYRISRQNRQSQNRHPAWTSNYGFPQAPDDVLSHDLRSPDLTYLKIFVALLDTGVYVAGFFNSKHVPRGLQSNPAFKVLFLPYDETQSAGLIRPDKNVLTLDDLAAAAQEAGTPAYAKSAPEVFEAIDQAKLLAGRRPSGQGRRQSSEERRAIELHAVEIATQHLTDEGWTVKDVSSHSSYDLLCVNGDKELHTEVKGTTGDGSAVLLTPAEVRYAREHHPLMCLAVVYGIKLSVDVNTGNPIANEGNLALMQPWNVDEDGELHSTGFEYVISQPSGEKGIP